MSEEVQDGDLPEVLINEPSAPEPSPSNSMAPRSSKISFGNNTARSPRAPKPISLLTFDEMRENAPVINSPRSLEACASLGYDPNELVKMSFDDFLQNCKDLIQVDLDHDGIVDTIDISKHLSVVQNSYETRERHRLEKIDRCVAAREDIMSQKKFANVGSVDLWMKKKFDASLKQERINMMLYRERYKKQLQVAFVQRVKTKRLAEANAAADKHARERLDQELKRREAVKEANYQRKLETRQRKQERLEENLRVKQQAARANLEKQKKTEEWRVKHFKKMKAEKAAKIGAQQAAHAAKLSEIMRQRDIEDEDAANKRIEHEEQIVRNKAFLVHVKMQKFVKARAQTERRNHAHQQAKLRLERKLAQERDMIEARGAENARLLQQRAEKVKRDLKKKTQAESARRAKKMKQIQARQQEIKDHETAVLQRKMIAVEERAKKAQEKLQLKFQRERLHEKLIKQQREEDRATRRRVLEYQHMKMKEKNEKDNKRQARMRESFATLRSARNRLRSDNENVIGRVRAATQHLLVGNLDDVDPIEISSKIGLDIKSVQEALNPKSSWSTVSSEKKNRSFKRDDDGYLSVSQNDEHDIITRLNKTIQQYDVEQGQRDHRAKDLGDHNRKVMEKNAPSLAKANTPGTDAKSPVNMTKMLPDLKSPRIRTRIKTRDLVGAAAIVGGQTLELQKLHRHELPTKGEATSTPQDVFVIWDAFADRKHHDTANSDPSAKNRTVRRPSAPLTTPPHRRVMRNKPMSSTVTLETVEVPSSKAVSPSPPKKSTNKKRLSVNTGEPNQSHGANPLLSPLSPLSRGIMEPYYVIIPRRNPNVQQN